MNVRVGLIAYSAHWEQILKLEGVPFLCDEMSTLVSACSVIIINRVLEVEERKLVEQYLGNGGAILGSAVHVDGVCGTQSRSEWVEYLLADTRDVFSNVSLLDLGAEARIPKEANHLRTQTDVHAVSAGPLGGGYAVIFPFDVAEVITDSRAAHKNFYAERDRLPTERVSLVNKGELHHILHDALKYLHHARNLSYVHAWYFPDGGRNVFAFRIDTDKGTRDEIDALYHVAVGHDVKMSWFLDVKSHEDWLHHFAFLGGQEIGIHCYEHQVYSSYDENLKNISKAKLQLERAGISSSGFSAPFGSWNMELAKAIDKIGFEYSSEFSYAYDTLPLYPTNRDMFFYALQVPIHPICIGSLKRSGYSESHMNEYFRRVIDSKLTRNEPLFFYHHPTHHSYDVMKFIFQYIEDLGIANLTMLEYARWWKKRLQGNPSASIAHDKVEIDRGNLDDSVWMRIIRPDGREAVVQTSGRHDMSALEWTTPPAIKIPDDIRRIREFDPRQMLSDVFTASTRKLAEGKNK